MSTGKDSLRSRDSKGGSHVVKRNMWWSAKLLSRIDYPEGLNSGRSLLYHMMNLSAVICFDSSVFRHGSSSLLPKTLDKAS